MTADWLAGALGASTGELTGFTAAAIGTGQMCDSFRLTLDWQNGPGPGRPPTIVAKCPSHDPASRAIAAQLGNYRLEVGWYRTLADRVPVACPACRYAAIADDGVDFLLLLGDLDPAQAGDQLAGAPFPSIRIAIDQAAALHASMWNSPELDAIAWLQRDSRPMVRTMFPALFAGFCDRYAGRLAADVLALGHAVVDRLDDYLGRQPSVRSLTHGDYRIDNLLFAPDGQQCWVVDWQTLGIGSGGSDVAYLVGTSIAAPDDQIEVNRAAFDHWADALDRHGVTPDRARLWEDYCIGALSGYFMAVFASMSVERTARGDEMFAVMAERPARQALALGSLDLL